MNAARLGQAAYEALAARLAAGDPWPLPDGPWPEPWEAVGDETRAFFADMAEAVLAAAPPGWATDYVARAADAVVKANRERDEAYASRDRYERYLREAAATLDNIANEYRSDYAGHLARGAAKAIRGRS